MNDWEELYQEGDVGWEKGEPSPGLVDWLAEHGSKESGRVLVPGCGFGHDVRAWAQAGYDVMGYDLAPSAVAGSRERTPKDLDRATFRLGDFLEDEPFDTFDFIFVPCTHPSAIVDDSVLIELIVMDRPPEAFTAAGARNTTDEGDLARLIWVVEIAEEGQCCLQ